MNMSYCRYQNTLNDLRDCAGDLEARIEGGESEPLSRDEREARDQLFHLMADMLEAIGADIDISRHELDKALATGPQ